MLQAAKNNKIKCIATVICLLCVLSLGVAVGAAFLNTNRDTRPAPKKLSPSSMKIERGYGEPIYETDDYKFYFREDRDVIAIQDVKTGYIWKTGIDTPFYGDVEEAGNAVLKAKEDGDKSAIKECADYLGITEEEVRQLAENGIDSSFSNSDQYTAFANSIFTLEYYQGDIEGGGEPVKVSSAAYNKNEGDSSLVAVDAANGEFKLECLFDLDGEALGVNVYITFSKDGTINYKVPYDEITGDGFKRVHRFIISPMLGASGGGMYYFDNESGTILEEVKAKEITPGYAVIPDGSGSLIRFNENNTTFKEYTGTVYGDDPATQLNDTSSLDDVVPVKELTMPVFGVSLGDGTQTAFVAYADSGDEYMDINVKPYSSEEGEERYTYTYPSFEYNTKYTQFTDQAKTNMYNKLQEEQNKFDIDITYKFLNGDGTGDAPKADYTGMAQAYRQHLIDAGVLKEITSDDTDIPIRVDMLMADSKKGVFSTQEVVVTTANDVRNILNKLSENGVKNINSGLIGWQSGGETLSKPYSTSFSGDIGTEGDFESLMADMAKKNIDVSFSREFVTINEDMISYYNNATKHINSQYLSVHKAAVLPKNVPVDEYGYARPERTAEWIGELYDEIGEYSKSYTIDGASNILTSSYQSEKDKTSRTDSIKLYQDKLAEISGKGTKLNLVSPNLYLWKYTDRYLQSDVGTSQYLYETDTVPFLQMVLHGTMEVYAPYANFSFYSQTDMLRMIDYNISPSFVLTQQPSYLLGSTTSSDYYSTEFSQYEELVGTIYNTVNGALSQVINYKWEARDVLKDGVIANRYSKDGQVKTIIINYTDEETSVNGTAVAAMSAAVIEGGVK